MKNILVIGAGNLGSRHLQSLRKVKTPLKIHVVDPNPESLNVAKNRFYSISSSYNDHEVDFIDKFIKLDDLIDIAIIATCSDVRAGIIEQLLELNKVKYLFLEKILFQKPDDYYKIKELLRKNKCKAWVNCSRRIIPFYKDQIKEWIHDKKISYSISGSNWGLISNAIHLLDYMVYLLDDYDYEIDTTYLNPKPIRSRRKGFLELTGILQFHFKNDIHGIFQCFPTGQLPMMEHIFSDTLRALIFLDDIFVRVWNSKNDLKWEEFELKMSYTSETTTLVVEDILSNGNTSLTDYETSMKLHLDLYNQVLKFLNEKSREKYDYYPFT